MNMTPPSATAPHPRTLWRLAIRDGHTGLHDMAWVRERYRQLLAEYGYPETTEPGEQR